MKFRVMLVFCMFLALAPTSVFADYVLPYPSAMPGNKAYLLSRTLDIIKKYWSFGSIAQVKYLMSTSDKYLVEAKVLFEYKQYLLALDALDRSDREMRRLPEVIRRAKNESKHMTRIIDLVGEEMQAHESILINLGHSLPQEYVWTPEKTAPEKLAIGDSIDTAINIRRSVRASL